ncbi:MAG: glycerophosphodiester phosphodiesterase [bacterium]
MRRPVSAAAPLTVAHRAGNELEALRAACTAGVDLIEADVHYRHGRLEIRHFKTMGRVPLLWDKWALKPIWTHSFQLQDLLAVAPGDCELMFDVKGGLEHFPREIVRVVRELMPDREYSVCSQFWELLSAFHEDPNARIVHSIGSKRMLRDVLPRLEGHRSDAVSIHMKLLTPAIVEDLLRRVSLIMTWPVNREADLRRLQSWGVNGFISDNLDLLRVLVRENAESGGPEVIRR